MKLVLTETALLGEAIVFWLVALPAAAIVFPAIALAGQIARLLKSGPVYSAACEG